MRPPLTETPALQAALTPGASRPAMYLLTRVVNCASLLAYLFSTSVVARAKIDAVEGELAKRGWHPPGCVFGEAPTADGRVRCQGSRQGVGKRSEAKRRSGVWPVEAANAPGMKRWGLCVGGDEVKAGACQAGGAPRRAACVENKRGALNHSQFAFKIYYKIERSWTVYAY